MEELLYQMIFKRKSFHIFREREHISPSELREIERLYQRLQPLVENIRTSIRILPAEETTCRRGEEYCILLYSEKKDNYLQNIGYIGEQLDLYLASMGIGALWYGIGKPDNTKYNGLEFVIMIGIAKMSQDKFRKDMFKSKRKPVEEIWKGDCHQEVGNIARFAPSACNTQPWIVEAESNSLSVYRYKMPGKRGIMPIDKVAHYNRIDIGIFLLFLELCLEHEGICYDRSVYLDVSDDEAERVPAAKYDVWKG